MVGLSELMTETNENPLFRWMTENETTADERYANEIFKSGPLYYESVRPRRQKKNGECIGTRMGSEKKQVCRRIHGWTSHVRLGSRAMTISPMSQIAL